MKSYEAFTSRVIRLPIDNIDTDQIFPGRFLTTTSKDNLAAHLFHDLRHDAHGSLRAGFPFNEAGAADAHILLAGDNFGCGSSREHAVWALVQFGIRAVIATSFADIFAQNALKNALLPVTVSARVHSEIIDVTARDPQIELSIDLAARALRIPGGRLVEFSIDPFARRCMLEGVDELGYILSREPFIRAYEQRNSPAGTSPFHASS